MNIIIDADAIEHRASCKECEEVLYGRTFPKDVGVDVESQHDNDDKRHRYYYYGQECYSSETRYGKLMQLSLVGLVVEV